MTDIPRRSPQDLERRRAIAEAAAWPLEHPASQPAPDATQPPTPREEAER